MHLLSVLPYVERRITCYLCKELIEDSNSKSGYAINTRKFQEYPSKPFVSRVKCAENTKAYLWNFVEGEKNKILQLKEKSSKLYNKDHQIPAHKSNELSFYTGKLQELENIEKKTEKPLNNIIHVHNQLRKKYHPAACANAEERRRKRRVKENKTPAQAFTPPADEKKMGTILWIFVYYAVYGSGRGRCRDFLVLKWGGGVLICKYGI